MRTVYACSLSFPAPIDTVWKEVAAWITGWYGKKAPGLQLPKGWDAGTTGVLEPVKGHTLEVTSARSASGSAQLREIRWRYPDQYDPSLIWASDLTVYADTHEVLFTLALRIASFDFELLPAKFELGTPRIVRTLVSRGDASVGTQKLPASFERIEAPDVPRFAAHLLDQRRKLPVVVLSSDPFTERPNANPTAVASALAGNATVAVMGSKWAAFALTDEIGKQFSCFNGAIRIYWPRFNTQADPFFHRLWLPTDVARAEQGPGFALELLRTVAPAGAFRFVEPEKIRTFRRLADQERLDALKAEKSEDYAEVFGHWDEETKKNAKLLERIEELISENATLRDNFNAVWTVAPKPEDSPTVGSADQDQREVSSVEEALEEAKRRTKHLHFLPEAIKSAKDSPFKQPQKALNALLAIDEVARAWMLQLRGRKGAFEDLGFEYADDISQTTRGKHGKEYVYRYEGENTSFEPHITMGAKQADKCLSIHMHWDDNRRRVAIAHVGRHKSNTTT